MAQNNQTFLQQIGGPIGEILYGGKTLGFQTETPTYEAWAPQYTKDVFTPEVKETEEGSLSQIRQTREAIKAAKEGTIATWEDTTTPEGKYENPLEAYKASLDPSLQFLASAEVANKGYGARGGGGDAGTIASELTKYADAGVNFSNKSGDSAEQIQRMSADLARYGVNSLSEIKAYQLPAPSGKGTVDVFYNTRTGVIIPTEFGSSMKGEGGSKYSLRNINGYVVPAPSWMDTSEAADFAPLVMAVGIGASLFLGPAASAIGEAIVGTGASATTTAFATSAAQAGLSGLVSGTTSALSGGDFGEGFVTGAVGSAIGSVVGFADPGSLVTADATIGKAINKALGGSLSGAAGAALSSGDVGDSALKGFVSGAVSGLTSPLLGSASGVAGSLASGLLSTGEETSSGGATSSGTTSAQTGTAGTAATTAAETKGGGYGNPSQFIPTRGITRRA